MADATEYFWDEDTQLYYYYDEEADAYVPYIEDDEGDEDEEQEEDDSAEPTQALLTGVDDSGAEVASDRLAEVASDAVAEVEDEADEISPLEGGQGSEGGDLSHRHSIPTMNRALSFAEHGGLAGCLAIAHRGRVERERQGTLILSAHDQEALLREAREQAVESRQLTKTQEPVDPGGHVDANVAAAAFFNPRGRKTTAMRFGTRNFGNPNADNSLAQLLNRQLTMSGGSNRKGNKDSNDADGNS